MKLEDIADVNNMSIYFESDYEYDEDLNLTVNSLYTYYLYKFWKKLYYEYKFETDEYQSNPESEINKEYYRKWKNSVASICYILIVIYIIIAFQLISLISLEFNLYNITTFEKNAKLSVNVTYMKELNSLHALKSTVDPYTLKLSSFYDNFMVEFPGAYMIDNYHALAYSINEDKTYDNYQSNGLAVYPYPDRVRPFPVFDYNEYSPIQALFTNPKGEESYSSVPQVIKDSYDLRALKLLNVNSYNSFVKEMMKMKLIQSRYKDYTQGSFDKETQEFTSSTLINNTDDALHYYWDLREISIDLSETYPCLFDLNVPSGSTKGMNRNDQFTLEDANHSLCNFECLSNTRRKGEVVFDYYGYQATQDVDGKGNEYWKEECNCYREEIIDPLIDELEELPISLCAIKEGISINKVSGLTRFDKTTYGLYFKPLYFDDSPDRHKIQFDNNTDQSSLKTWKHSDLNDVNLSGSFVYPVHIPKYKNCDAGVGIDFMGDLIAYPIILDSYNQNKMTNSIGYRVLNHNENKYYEALMDFPRFSISNKMEFDLVIYNCSSLCQAYDYFGINNRAEKEDQADNSPSSSSTCLCGMNSTGNKYYQNKDGEYIRAKPDISWVKSLPEPPNNNFALDGYTFSFFTYMNLDSEDGESNYVIADMLSNQDEVKVVTAIRNKTVIIPKINRKLECEYDGIATISMFSNGEVSLHNVTIQSLSPMQYSRVMVDGQAKTLYICTPDIQSFDTTYTIYPNFEQTFEADEYVNPDMRYHFGNTVAGSWKGCPIVDKDAKTVEYSELSQSVKTDTRIKLRRENSIQNFYKRFEDIYPRSLSYSKYYDKLTFTYYSDMDMKNTEENILLQLTKELLNEAFNYEFFKNITVVFCYFLVLLSIFDESNECLFVIYTISRIFYVYMYHDIDKKYSITNFLLYTIAMWTCIFRIGILTYKIFMITFLMNWNVTVDQLLMNSLALIFILEMDTISYTWLFDKSKTYEIQCRNYFKNFFRIKIVFNLQYYLTIFGCIYFSYVGIYDYTFQFKNLYEITRSGNYQAICYALCYILNFGTLINECSSKLYTLIKFKKQENNYFIIFWIYICIYFSVYSVFIIFILSDYSFYYYDFRMCLKAGNLNCANNIKISTEVFENNLIRVSFTLIFVLFNIIWEICKYLIRITCTISSKPDSKYDEEAGLIPDPINQIVYTTDKEINKESNDIKKNSRDYKAYKEYNTQTTDKSGGIEERINVLEFKSIIQEKRLQYLYQYDQFLKANKLKPHLIESDREKHDTLVSYEMYIECNGIDINISDDCLMNIYKANVNALNKFKKYNISIEEAILNHLNILNDKE